MGLCLHLSHIFVWGPSLPHSITNDPHISKCVSQPPFFARMLQPSTRASKLCNLKTRCEQPMKPRDEIEHNTHTQTRHEIDLQTKHRLNLPIEEPIHRQSMCGEDLRGQHQEFDVFIVRSPPSPGLSCYSSLCIFIRRARPENPHRGNEKSSITKVSDPAS